MAGSSADGAALCTGGYENCSAAQFLALWASSSSPLRNQLVSLDRSTDGYNTLQKYLSVKFRSSGDRRCGC